MAGFTTTDDGWSFDLGAPADLELPANSDVLEKVLGTPERWANYCDDDLYMLEKLLRKWFAACRESSRWMKTYKNRRYTMGMVVERIFGRKWDSSIDCRYSKKLKLLLQYYSTSVKPSGVIAGKKTNHPVYVIGTKRIDKRPYSLRLRIEELAAEGILPDRYNMVIRKDDLCEVGKARNKNVQKRIDERRARARARYNERYAGRNHQASRRDG